MARITSSYHIYEHPDAREIISVPVHGNRDLKPGTQKGIMRAAGLSDEDL